MRQADGRLRRLFLRTKTNRLPVIEQASPTVAEALRQAASPIPSANEVGATPSPLGPHQHRRPAEQRQISEWHPTPVLEPRPCPTGRTRHGRRGGLHMDPERSTRPDLDSEHVHVGQPDKQHAHARSVGLHKDSGGSVGVRTTDSPGPCATPGGPPPADPALRHHTPLKSEAPGNRAHRNGGFSNAVPWSCTITLRPNLG